MEASIVYSKHDDCLIMTEHETSLREMVVAAAKEFKSLTLEEVGFPDPLRTWSRYNDLFVGSLACGEFIEYEDSSQMSLCPKLSLASAMREAKKSPACQEDFGNVFFFTDQGTLIMIVKKLESGFSKTAS